MVTAAYIIFVKETFLIRKLACQESSLLVKRIDRCSLGLGFAQNSIMKAWWMMKKCELKINNK